MSRFAEDAAARIVRSLSASFKKKLTIVDSASADAKRSLALTPATSIQFDQPLTAAFLREPFLLDREILLQAGELSVLKLSSFVQLSD